MGRLIDHQAWRSRDRLATDLSPNWALGCSGSGRGRSPLAEYSPRGLGRMQRQPRERRARYIPRTFGANGLGAAMLPSTEVIERLRQSSTLNVRELALRAHEFD